MEEYKVVVERNIADNCQGKCKCANEMWSL
jgi:hypothetical protein